MFRAPAAHIALMEGKTVRFGVSGERFATYELVQLSCGVDLATRFGTLGEV